MSLMLAKVMLNQQELISQVESLSDFLTARHRDRFRRDVFRAADLEGGQWTVDDSVITSLFREAFISGGRATSSVQRLINDFDPTNPRSIKMMREQGARLVTSITNEQRDSLKAIMTKGMEQGLNSDQIAAKIRRSIGLHPRYAMAVDNYHRGLITNGTPPGKAAEMADKYAKRLQASRADTIARTEVQTAIESAKLEYWRQAIDAGVIGEGSLKVWHLGKSCIHCDHCLPLEGKAVAIEEPFYTGLGPVLIPPLHPNCCCSTMLQAEVLRA